MITLVKEYGLGIALSIGTFSTLIYIIKWVLGQQDKIMARSDEERKGWQLLFERNNKSIDEHVINSRMAHEATSEAHRAQRVEHNELVKQMAEVTVALGRINGFKL